MGHLSKSDHIGSNGCVSNGSTTITEKNNTDSICNNFKNGTIKLSENTNDPNNNVLPTGTFTNDDESDVNDYHNSKNTKLDFTADHRNKTDLNVYFDEWKNDKVFGIQFKAPLKWDKVIQISLLHLYFLYVAVYEIPFLVITNMDLLNWQTVVFSLFCGGWAGLGVTGGAHRLWTHRSYKAKVPLRIILMLGFSMAGQNTLFDWVRDHRVHHKYSETDADPHNAGRGFFFSHVGWLMMYKHPQVIKRGRQIDMSDVLNDPVVQFHQKYFIPLKALLCFIIPTMIPIWFWNEDPYVAFVSQGILRYVASLNMTWSVNSAAHLWGYRPYDRKINPAENRWVSFWAMGEGWHNYHHTFPWDYKTAELGVYSLNITTMWLDIFSKLGWSYDLKEPSKELVRRTVERSGDGTHDNYGHDHPVEVLPEEDIYEKKDN